MRCSPLSRALCFPHLNHLLISNFFWWYTQSSLNQIYHRENDMEAKPDNNSPVQTALNSTVLKIVVIGKTVISLALVIAAIFAIYFGGNLLLSVASGSNEMLVQFGNFKMTSSGLGVSIMASSLFFAFCAYLCRPKLVLTPPNRTKHNKTFKSDSQRLAFSL